MNFSPQPSYQFGKYDSEIAAPNAGSDQFHFESISLKRERLGPIGASDSREFAGKSAEQEARNAERRSLRHNS
jgi:hypothetical protein